MTDTIYQAAALIIPLVLAIVFHEVAHGWTARALGDPTAAELNRLSLNPLRHVDPMGTIIVPGMLKLAGLPVFGWAKPVPVVPQRLRNPRVGMMLVAVAGPGMNLLMALAGAVALGLLVAPYRDAEPTGVTAFLMLNLVNFLAINVFLALFNLLPIPPFDGSHVVEGLLPRRAAAAYAATRPYAFFLMIALLVVLPTIAPELDVVRRFLLPPVDWTMDQYLAVVKAVAGA